MSNAELPERVLDTVRALLAKAESTQFEAEAEAFTAKAQELMARHRIEQAMLGPREPSGRNEPLSRRVLVPAPYAQAKATLLAHIAQANGCSAVWSKELGFTTVFGFGPELDAVDTLFASLLVQATGALRRHGAKFDSLGRRRTKRFRRSFLLSFAVRIGERLEATVAAAVSDARVELGAELVPVLADREARARAAAEAAFPEIRRVAPVITDGDGWYAGRVFADLVDLAVGTNRSVTT
jgi:Protein of unknown function (DUF2786)